MQKGLHHFHKKRIHKKYEKHSKDKEHPSKDKWKRFIDKIIYIGAVVGPIIAIPQIMKIWVEKNASGVSVISWSGYLVSAIFWLIYGVVHKEKPIVVTNIIWIFLQAIIVVGTLIYG